MVRTNMQESWSIPGVIGVSDNFGNTDWWVVRQASREGEPEADPARSRLCQDYWRPVFRYIRRSGRAWHDAQDLTQEFFFWVLKRNSLKTAAQDKGKFRSFLLTLLKRFLADQCDRARCQKRGGDAQLLSLDGGDTEFRRRVEPINELNPETICERHWVESILQTVLKQLEQECASSGKGRVFESVRDLVTGECEVSCAEAATALNMTPAHVRVIVHRLRQRLRQLLGDAVADENKSESRLKQELLDTYQACRD